MLWPEWVNTFITVISSLFGINSCKSSCDKPGNALLISDLSFRLKEMKDRWFCKIRTTIVCISVTENASREVVGPLWWTIMIRTPRKKWRESGWGRALLKSIHSFSEVDSMHYWSSRIIVSSPEKPYSNFMILLISINFKKFFCFAIHAHIPLIMFWQLYMDNWVTFDKKHRRHDLFSRAIHPKNILILKIIYLGNTRTRPTGQIPESQYLTWLWNSSGTWLVALYVAVKLLLTSKVCAK